MNARLDPIIERFRYAHHTVAMMFAMGMTVQEISKRTGFTQRRLMILLDDPTFNELIGYYATEHREQLRQAIPEAQQMMIDIRTMGLRQIHDWLEEADEEGAEKIPLPTLLKVTADMNDRTGYSKHTAKTVNLDISFANQLDRAIERSGKGELVRLTAPQIEGEVLHSANPAQHRAVVQMPRPRTFRRA